MDAPSARETGAGPEATMGPVARVALSGVADGRGDGAGRGVLVRGITPSDSISDVTGLLHRAYAKQVGMGLRPLAARQDDATTMRRVSSGECFVAEVVDASGERTGRLVGVIILNEAEPDAGPAWFGRPGVCSFSQFAVDPLEQGLGVGRALLGVVEARAAALGNTELGLSMAEPDRELRDYYLRRGFRIVGTWQWPYTNYMSLIMSKRLGRSAAPAG